MMKTSEEIAKAVNERYGWKLGPGHIVYAHTFGDPKVTNRAFYASPSRYLGYATPDGRIVWADEQPK